MGNDNYHPIAKKGSNLTQAGGVGYMIIDSLDAMQIMGLTEEYQRARNWVEKSLSFDRDAHFNAYDVCRFALSSFGVPHKFELDDIPSSWRAAFRLSPFR